MELEPSLLAAVLADPEADEPREIAADWFDEHGDTARAAFIRHQLAIARGPADDRAVARATRHAAELLRAHGHRWRRSGAPTDLEWGQLERGFVSTVRVLRVGALFEHADAIWAQHPIDTIELRPHTTTSGDWIPRPLPVRKLRIVSGDLEPIRELDAVELNSVRTLLPTIRELEIVILDEWEDGYWEIVNGAELSALRHLRVRGHHTSATMYARRAVEAGWPLETLDLGTDFVDYDSGYFDDPTLGGDGARLLAQAPSLENLRHLNLDLQRLGTDGLAIVLDAFRQLETLSARRMELSELPPLPEGAPLAQLRLGTNDIGTGGLDFLDQPRTAHLRSLDLVHCGLDDLGVARIVRSPAWSSLRSLEVSGELFGAGAWFAEGPPPPHLHTLQLRDCGLGPDDVRALLGLSWVRALERLELGQNDVGEAVEDFAAARIPVLGLSSGGLPGDHLVRALPGLRRCEELDLSHNPIGGFVGTLLADAPELAALELRGVRLARRVDGRFGQGAPRLTRLGLAATDLGDDGLVALLESDLGRRLVDLDLSNCDLGPRAVDALIAWPGLERVHRLVLFGNREIDEAEVVRLAEAVSTPLPGMRVPGYRWRFSPQTNALLDERFGPDWDSALPPGG